MRTTIVCIQLLAAMALLAVLPGQAAEKPPFTGTEAFYRYFLDMGKAICPGTNQPAYGLRALSEAGFMKGNHLPEHEVCSGVHTVYDKHSMIAAKI